MAFLPSVRAWAGRGLVVQGKGALMRALTFKRHRFPAEIIHYAVWLYFRFTLSFRDVEELLA